MVHLHGLAAKRIGVVGTETHDLSSSRIYSMLLLRRRRRIQPGPFPARIYVRSAVSVVIFVGPRLNVAGVASEPNGAPYALALTWFGCLRASSSANTDAVLGGKPTA